MRKIGFHNGILEKRVPQKYKNASLMPVELVTVFLSIYMVQNIAFLILGVRVIMPMACYILKRLLIYEDPI